MKQEQKNRIFSAFVIAITLLALAVVGYWD